MLKILRSKKRVEEATKLDKAIQCDLFDAYLRVYIIEKLPMYSEPSVENFNAYSQRLHLIMNTFKIKEKDKVSYLFACIQGKANEMLQQSQVLVDGDTTWEQAITKLKELFDTSLIHGNIQTLKKAKQQPDQNFQEFTIIVQNMVHNIFTQKQGYTDAQREAETIRYSIRGTKNQLKQQLKGKKYNSIADLILRAEALESTCKFMEQ